MSSGIVPGRFEQRRTVTAERHYHGLVLPGVKRNTFAAGNTIQTLPPAVLFKSAGLAIESSKLYEGMVETWTEDQIGGIIGTGGASITGDYVRVIKTTVSGNVSVPGNVTGAWVGISHGSFDANLVPSGVGDCGFLQVRKDLLADDTYYIVSRCSASQRPPVSATVVLPHLGAYPGGADLVEIHLNPYTRAADVFLRGMHVWSLADPADYPDGMANVVAYPAVSVGFLVWSGTQTGPATINGMLGPTMVVDYGLQLLGSGNV